MPGPTTPDVYLREITSLSYTLPDILQSQSVYDAFLTAAGITLKRGGIESAFAIGGDGTNIELTIPAEGEKDRVHLPGRIGAGMTVGHQYGEGLHLPEYLFSLVECHFHPPNNYAVLSRADMMGFAPNRFDLFSGDEAIVPVQVVGHYNPQTNTKFLFFWQYHGHDTAIGTHNAAEIASTAYRKMRRLSGNLNPVDNAMALDSIDNFRAAAFQFKGKKRYRQRVQRDIAGKFTLFQTGVHNRTPDFEDAPSVDDELDSSAKRIAKLGELIEQLEAEDTRSTGFRGPRNRSDPEVNIDYFWGELE